MDRVVGKLNHWDNMRETTYNKRSDDQMLAEMKMSKKMEKIDKFGKKLETNLKDEVERIQAGHDKWATKIDQFKSNQKHLEN